MDMIGFRKDGKTTIERHIIEGKFVKMRKSYVLQTLNEPTKPAELKRWFKKGLDAEEILKYQHDPDRFGWVVWYI